MHSSPVILFYFQIFDFFSGFILTGDLSLLLFYIKFDELRRFPKVEPKDRLEQTGSKEGLLSTTVTGIIVENEVLSDDDDDKDDDDFGEERVGAGALEDGDENIAGIRLAQASGGEGDFSEVEASGQVNGGYHHSLPGVVGFLQICNVFYRGSSANL